MEHLTDIGVIKELFDRHGFSFSKRLGQNFLVNPTVCPRIAEAGGAAHGVGVIEIGTGVGVLTNELARRAEKVAAIEIDDRLLSVLAETLAEHPNVKVICADVLKTDLRALIADEFAGLSVCVCANLPYYITSPVIMKLLEDRLPVKRITVMVQREAGERLCALMGSREMGAVTVAVRYFSEPKILFNVSRGSFLPSPNVDSCVVQFEIRDQTPAGVTDEAFFFRTVRAAFSQRRKTLVNSVASGLGIPKATVTAACEQAALPATVRPEQLSMGQFIAFAETLAAAQKAL
ncbi:MAG: 16S rRNA (adenine(1518)-N(6)/adenine(1519)-N(6))-dimethyltransferase RsmA [Oscillospiraceae bacterium]